MIGEIMGVDGLFFVLYLASLVLVVIAVVDISRRPRAQMSLARKMAWTWPCVLGWFVLGIVGGVVAVVYLVAIRPKLNRSVL